jgi:group I intron endonuclease
MYKITGVYKVFNTLDGHCYIGSAVNVQTRINEHFRNLRHNRHGNIYLQAAYNKYGEVFDVELLAECTPGMLLFVEEYFFKCYNKGQKYNILDHAGNNLGYKHTEQSLEKIRQANTGKHLTEETKEKLRQAHLGQSTGFQPGHNCTTEAKEKIRLANTGRKLSVESLEKMRQSLIGNKNCQGHHWKLSKEAKEHHRQAWVAWEVNNT